MEDRYLPLFEEADTGEAPPEKPRKKAGTAQVVLVQCICCAVLLLFFWLFKVFGGTAYTQLRSAFMNALQNNALLATVAQLFDDTAPDESYQLSGGTTVAGTTTGSTTAATTAATTAGTAQTTAAPTTADG